MFTEKKINIFDKKAIEVGSFITFCQVEKDYEYDSGPIWNNKLHQNGIITTVTETYLEVATISKSYQLFINRVIGSPSFEEESYKDVYKILGIIPNAIK